MWPTDTTVYLLLLGLTSPFYELFRAARLGMQEATSMRFCGVLFLWIGYHLSPWLAYFGDQWNNFMLVPPLIDRGLLFSWLCMVAFVVGHWCVMGGRRTWARPWGRGLIGSYQVSAAMLFAAASVSVLLFLIDVGGFGEVWQSSVGRGVNQFEERDMFGRILHMLAVLQTMTTVLGVCLASLFMLSGRASMLRMLGGLVALLAFSLSAMHGFSRGAGFAFILLGLVALYLKGLRGIKIATVAISVGLFLGSVGYGQRNNFYPGIGNFMEAVPLVLEAMIPNEPRVVMEEKPETEINPYDSMGAWTRVAAVADDVKPDPLGEGVNLLLSLSPLPSELFPTPGVGPDLTVVMGTGTSVGLTTPVLSQFYYALGFGGASIMVMVGSIYGWFDRLRVVRPGTLAMLCALICLASLAVGLHSSFRAMTRPLLYAFILFQGYSWFSNLRER